MENFIEPLKKFGDVEYKETKNSKFKEIIVYNPDVPSPYITDKWSKEQINEQRKKYSKWRKEVHREAEKLIRDSAYGREAQNIISIKMVHGVFTVDKCRFCDTDMSNIRCDCYEYSYSPDCSCYDCPKKIVPGVYGVYTRHVYGKHKPIYIKMHGAVKIKKGRHCKAKKMQILKGEQRIVKIEIETFLCCYLRQKSSREILSILPKDIIILICNYLSRPVGILVRKTQ